MSKLTAAEKKWLKKVQAVLDECPSDRVAFFTVGDRQIHAYDASKLDEILNYQNSKHNADFCKAVDACDASFDDDLTFNQPVESTAG
ncbi:hypothetical protein BCT75_04260 [Vibrio lentus]|jgi:hypothetical protein|uniref:hypothetical protein n=1 Tax=Vibrio lentus TaxID=136468 RepID=UPI000C85BBF8|nr:hypothetical protein [Vibrio lentus]PML45603.1 hypothetical protein BCT75_04260 [Vibrio lentus]